MHITKMVGMVSFLSVQLSGVTCVLTVVQPSLLFIAALFSTCNSMLFPVGGKSGSTVHVARVLRASTQRLSLNYPG